MTTGVLVQAFYSRSVIHISYLCGFILIFFDLYDKRLFFKVIALVNASCERLGMAPHNVYNNIAISLRVPQCQLSHGMLGVSKFLLV